MITNFNNFKLNENNSNNLNWVFVDNRIYNRNNEFDESIQLFDKAEGGGSKYDLKVKFSVLDEKPASKLEIFDDNFNIFSEKFIVDFFVKVNKKNLDINNFKKELLKHGFLDSTIDDSKDFYPIENLKFIFKNFTKFHPKHYYIDRFRDFYNSFEFQDNYLSQFPDDVNIFLKLNSEYSDFLNKKTIEKYKLETKILTDQYGF
jgi:hypothetical protein